jgi:Tat protein translocase TatB subunit
MFNIGGGEILVIFLVALIVLGPQKLPEAAKQVGAMMRELKKVSTGFQDELRAAIDFTDEDDAIEAAARAKGDQLIAAEKAEKAAKAARTPKAVGSGTGDPGTSTAAAAGMYGAPGAKLSAGPTTPEPAPSDEVAGAEPALDDHDDDHVDDDDAVLEDDDFDDVDDDDLDGVLDGTPDDPGDFDDDDLAPSRPARMDVTQMARNRGAGNNGRGDDDS